MNQRPASYIFIILSFIVVLALGLRILSLSNRPMHADEAVHTIKFKELWEKGIYHYDANEFHGPTPYYAALPVMVLRGRTTFADTRESDYRLAIALFGAGMVLLLALATDGLGRLGTVIAGLLTALSPAMVFYSRYFIQEIPFTFFTLAALVCGWRYTQNRAIGWAIATGVSIGLAIASKETVVLSLFAAIIAGGILRFLPHASVGRGRNTEVAPTPDPWATSGHRALATRPLIASLFAALFIACLCLTGFGTNWMGPIDYLKSYTPWLGRAHGTNLHLHPWDYYLRILIWPSAEKEGPISTELLIVGLALVGAGTALFRPKSLPTDAAPVFVRFVAVYALLLTAIYSIIPYKTPWCLLTFLSGMILLAGVGAATLLQALPEKPLKAAAILLLLAGMVHLGWGAYQVSFPYVADPKNPYVYSSTAPEAAKLKERVEALARAHPQGEKMVVQVVWKDDYYWPLPWYLRRFPNVGYWTSVPPEIAEAPVVLADPAFDEELTKRLDATHLMTGFFGLRHGVVVQVWVRLDLWEPYLKTLPKESEE